MVEMEPVVLDSTKILILKQFTTTTVCSRCGKIVVLDSTKILILKQFTTS